MSLFRDLGGLVFTSEEINAVNVWRNALRATGPVGQAIERNCQLETRVNDDIRAEFLKHILKRFAETQNPIGAIQDAVFETKDPANPDPLLLKGPKVKINLPDGFGRLETYRSIRRFSKDDAAETMDELILPQEDDVESGQTIDSQRLPDKLYSNRYGFIWATDADLINSNPGTDELCCRLGLSHVREGTLLLKIVYPRNSVPGNCLFPTIVEGREGPSFQPADPGSDAGYTRDLRDNSARYPEWVHGAIPMRQVEYIGPAIQGNSRVSDSPVPEGYFKEKNK